MTMRKIKKLSIFILAGMITCNAPAMVMASDVSTGIEAVADELLESNQVQSLLSDPDKVADIILYVKEQLDGQEISDETMESVIDLAAEKFQVTLSDSDKQSVLKIARKLLDMDIDEEELRTQVKKVYSTMESLGVDSDDAKSFVRKAVDFIKGLFD
jgi:uncharacterized protein YpuA (DUF1002 family)